MAALPFLSNLPIDYDRIAPLVLLPAFWLARKRLRASRVLSSCDKLDRSLLAIAIVAAVIASAFGPHPLQSWVSLASLAWVLAGGALARTLVTSDPAAGRRLLIGISAGATMGCLTVWTFWERGTPVGEFPHYGHARLFGLHMMLGTVAALGWLGQTASRSAERLLAFLAALIACAGAFWSGGRTPLVGIAAAVAVSLWCSPRAQRPFLAGGVAAVLIGGVLLSLAQWTPDAYLGWWTALERSHAATTIDELSSTRLTVWQFSWNRFLEAPWLGHGLDSYRYLIPKHDGNQPHNWMLQFLLDFGVAGGVSLGLFLVRQTWRGIGRPGCADSSVSSWRQAAAVTLTACLVAGLLDGVFYHAITLVPAALLVGIAGAPDSLREATRERIMHAFQLVLAASGILLAWHVVVLASLLVLPPPPSATSPRARIVRAVPTTTFGIQRWLEHWRIAEPETTIAWAHWALRHSDDPAQLHAYAAVVQANRGDSLAALREVEDALRKAHIRAIPRFRRLEQAILNKASAKDGGQSQSEPPL